MNKRMDFKRFENETDDELIRRIISNKEVMEWTWPQTAEILNSLLGVNRDESTYRKKWKADNKKTAFSNGLYTPDYTDGLYTAENLHFNKDMSTVQSNYASISDLHDLIKSIDKKVNKHVDEALKNKTASETDKLRKLEKERAKLRTEKQEYNKWLREEARDEMIKDEIIRAISELEPLEVPGRVEVKPNNKARLLCISDAHYGLEFFIEDLFGYPVNQYSPEIFESRMWTLLDKVVEIINKENFDTLYVWELGDGPTSILRLNSQLMKLRWGAIDQVIHYSNFLATWLNELSKYVRVNFQMVGNSNHCQMRICGAPKNSFPEEDLSKISRLLIKERLKNNPNFNILENPSGLNYSQLTIWTVLGIHGEVKDMKTAIDEYQRMYQTQIDYLVAGHMHHNKSEEIGRNSAVLNVGSIIGIDDYAMSLRKTSNASASLYTFDQLDGLIREDRLVLN